MPLGGIKSSLEIVCFQVVPERVECIDERIESGREFQTVDAVARKEHIAIDVTVLVVGQ